MPSTFIMPFDFRKIFVDYFLGDGGLFALAFIIFYSYMAAYFGMSNKLYFFFLIVGAIIFAGIIGSELYTIALILFGGFVFKALAEYIV